MSQLTNTFSAIANAIRNKLGVNTTYKPSQMAGAINSMRTSGRVIYCTDAPQTQVRMMYAEFIFMTDLQWQIIESSSGTRSVPSVCKLEFLIQLVETATGNKDIVISLMPTEGLSSHTYNGMWYYGFEYWDAKLEPNHRVDAASFGI